MQRSEKNNHGEIEAEKDFLLFEMKIPCQSNDFFEVYIYYQLLFLVILNFETIFM